MSRRLTRAFGTSEDIPQKWSYYFVDIRVESDVSEATWSRYAADDAFARCEMSELTLKTPEGLIWVGRDGGEYFITAQFAGGRGTREIARGELSDMIAQLHTYEHEGLPMGPHHVAERAHAWTHYIHDHSIRATTPTGEVRTRPFLGGGFALIHVPDHSFRLFVVHDDEAWLKANAYRLASSTDFPRAAICVGGQIHEFRVSNRRCELAYAKVGEAMFTLVPAFTDDGRPCVAVEVAAQRTVREEPVRRLAVHTLPLPHVLWSDENQPGGSPLPPWRAPAEPGDAKAKSCARSSPQHRPSPGTTSSSGAATAPPGADPLAWEGFELQLHDLAARSHDHKGRRLYAVEMRARAVPLLIALARKGVNIQGHGRQLRCILEQEGESRLPGGHSTFKSLIAILARDSDICRSLNGHKRQFVFAELFRADSPVAVRLRAYALAARARGRAGVGDHPQQPEDMRGPAAPWTPSAQGQPIVAEPGQPRSGPAHTSPAPPRDRSLDRSSNPIPPTPLGAPPHAGIGPPNPTSEVEPAASSSIPPPSAAPPSPARPPRSTPPTSDPVPPTASPLPTTADTELPCAPSPPSMSPASRRLWWPPPPKPRAGVPSGSIPQAPLAHPLREQNVAIRPRHVADLGEDLANDPWVQDLEKPAETARGPPKPPDDDE